MSHRRRSPASQVVVVRESDGRLLLLAAVAGPVVSFLLQVLGHYLR